MILLAEHDESSLAAKKKQRQVALETPTSTPKNRVWNFFDSALGRPGVDPDLSWENATGSVQYSYKNASGQGSYYTRDHLGSVREMTDGSGTIQARYDYDAYGRVTTITGTVPSDFQYAGYYTHAASGLNFTLNRAYDSNTARWLSRDPYIDADGNDPEIASGPNLYLYVGNNPINKVDPLGLDGQFAGMFTPSNNQGTNPPASPAVAAGMGAAALTGTGILAGMAAVDLWPILARDLKIDGPAARGGRICQLRLGPTPIARLDYHPIPGSGGQPVLHLNIGPGQGPNSIHIPLWPY